MYQPFIIHPVCLFTINGDNIKLNAFRLQTPLLPTVDFNYPRSSLRTQLWFGVPAVTGFCSCCGKAVGVVLWPVATLSSAPADVILWPVASCHPAICTRWRNTSFYSISFLHVRVSFWMEVHVPFLREGSHRVIMYTRISATMFPCSWPYQQHHLFCILTSHSNSLFLSY